MRTQRSDQNIQSKNIKSVSQKLFSGLAVSCTLALGLSTLGAASTSVIDKQAVSQNGPLSANKDDQKEPKFGALKITKLPKRMRAPNYVNTRRTKAKVFNFTFKGPGKTHYSISTPAKTIELVNYVYPGKLSKKNRTSNHTIVPHLHMRNVSDKDGRRITASKQEFVISVFPNTYPGKYRIRPAVTAVINGKTVVKRKTKYITILGNKKVSKRYSEAESWSSKWSRKANLVTPTHYWGAKTTLYCQKYNKKTGKHKWVKAKTGKVKNLRSQEYKAMTVFKMPNKCSSSGKIKYKVGKAKYSPGYTTKAMRIGG